MNKFLLALLAFLAAVASILVAMALYIGFYGSIVYGIYWVFFK